MSKAFRKVEKTNSPPGCMRFERHLAPDSAAAKQRKRAISERLKGSGSQLADATQKIPTHTEESKTARSLKHPKD